MVEKIVMATGKNKIKGSNVTVSGFPMKAGVFYRIQENKEEVKVVECMERSETTYRETTNQVIVSYTNLCPSVRSIAEGKRGFVVEKEERVDVGDMSLEEALKLYPNLKIEEKERFQIEKKIYKDGEANIVYSKTIFKRFNKEEQIVSKQDFMTNLVCKEEELKNIESCYVNGKYEIYVYKKPLQTTGYIGISGVFSEDDD